MKKEKVKINSTFFAVSKLQQKYKKIESYGEDCLVDHIIVFSGKMVAFGV